MAASHNEHHQALGKLLVGGACVDLKENVSQLLCFLIVNRQLISL